MDSGIWTEKYRPSKFSELVGQDAIVKRVESLVNSLNIPHLLFAGPAGTGKSTLALITVKELLKLVDSACRDHLDFKNMGTINGQWKRNTSS